MLFGDIQNLAHDWALELIWENGSWKDEKRPSELLLRERESDRQGFFKTVRTQIENTLGEVSPQYEALITAEENDLALRDAAYGLADQILNGNPNLGPADVAIYGLSTNGPAFRIYTMNYAREIMSDPEAYSLYGSPSAMDMDTVRQRYDGMLSDPLAQEAARDSSREPVTLERDIAFEITYGGDRFDAADVAAAVGPMTRQEMAAFRQRIASAAMEMYPQQDRAFVERQMDAYLRDVRIEEREEMVEEENEDRGWARFDADGYEVSTAGDARFSALEARFAPDTKLGSVDISGMTIEEVYQHVVKRSGKGLPPAVDSVAYNPDLHGDAEKEDYSYANGYLPLWTMWARQNPRLVAELRRKAAGRPLTDKFASTRVSQARALSDILNRRGAEFSDEEIARYFSAGERQVGAHPSLTKERLEGYDIYSVGLGRGSQAGLLSMIPEDTDIVVDMRNYNVNSHSTHFDHRSLVPALQRNGLEYAWMKDLSGRQWKRVPGSRVGGTEREPLIDYQAYAASPVFRQALDQLKALVVSGKKVCIIGSGADAAYDARGLLLGQELERTTNLRIAHIDDRAKDGSLRIRSQEEVIQAAIGRRSEIEGGDFLNLHFMSDGQYTADPGVSVVRSDAALDGAGREIEGSWNYASRGDISEISGGNAVAPGIATPFRASMAANAEWADHTIVFSASPSDREAKEAVSVAHDYTRIPLYSKDGGLSREDLEDPEKIARAAKRIEDRITRNLVYRTSGRGLPVEDLMALKINVAGSNIARIANTFVENPVTEEEISGNARRVLNRTGLKMDDQTFVGQEDVNRFVEAVLRKVVEDEKNFGAEDEPRPWNIGHVRTNGQSGVAEAATTAAQSMGLQWSVAAAKGYRYTIDNETLRGADVSDEASFKNRFHQGLRHDVTLQNLQEQIEMLDRRRMEREDGMQTGLTDRQVLVLHELGFGNNAMVDMIELARDNRVSVNSPADMAEFIGNAAGYGIPGAMDVTEDQVREAFRSAAEKQERWKEDGITFVSAASPYYPENLRHFKEEVRQEYVVEERRVDGKIEMVPVPQSVVVRRPALLWAKGDLSLLDNPVVSVIGNVATSNDTAGAARLLGGALSEADLPPVVTLAEGVGAEVAREAASRDGRVVAVSDDGIVTKERVEAIDQEIDSISERIDRMTDVAAGQAAESQAKMDRIDDLVAERNGLEGDPDAEDRINEINEEIGAIRADLESFLSTVQERDDLIARRDDLYAERMAAEREALADPLHHELQEDIVRGGGLVLSESEPDTRQKQGSDRSRADKLSAALGYGCAIIDATFSKNTNPMSPIAMAAYALYGVYQIGYKAVSPEKGEKEPTARRSARRVKDISPSGEGFPEMVEEVNAAYDAAREEVPQERAAVTEGIEQPAVEERAERIPSFFDYFFRGEDAQQEAEKVAEDVATAPLSELRQAPVHVIEYGGDRVYLVPDGQPQIVSALRERFGDDVRIAPLASEGGILRRLSHASVMVDGEEVPRFDGYKGTQMRIREPQTDTLYFYRGAIYTLPEVPSGVMGLEDIGRRRSAAALWEDVVASAKALQDEFQKAAGVDAQGQLRFENADHLRVGARSVDVLRGDELRARVWLSDKGEICKKNFGGIASDDFQEYHQIKTFPVFSDEDGIIAAEDVTGALDDMRQALWDRPYLEVRDEMEANLNREKKEERTEQLQNDFLEIRESNLEIAIKDVAEGRSAGLLPDPEALVPADRVALFAMADKAIATDTKKAASLQRDIDRHVRKIGELPSDKASEGERATLEDEMDRLVVERQRLFAEVADMDDLKASLAHGRNVSVAERSGKVQTLSLDGRMFRMKTRPVTEADREAATIALEDYRSKNTIHVEPAKKKETAAPSILFTESSSASYATRTVENAQAADVTIAMAVDFETKGEQHTLRAAGDKYVAVGMNAVRIADNPAEQGRLAAREVLESLKEKGLLKDKGISVNFAGNGIYTLAAAGLSQEAVDTYATALLSTLVREAGVKVLSVRSGGQTGMDEAGAKAGMACGLPTVIHAPASWKFRGADGRDVSDEAAFKERFGVGIKETVKVEGKKESVTEELTPERREERIAKLGQWLAAAERDPIMRETEEFAAKREEVQRLIAEKQALAEAKKSQRGLPPDTKIQTPFDQVNGICVLERKDGKMAYADRQMRVISDWYDKLSPMGRTFGTATREDGKFKLIDTAGREVVPRWLEGVSRSVEGLNMVKIDGKYNFLDLGRAELISKADFVRATDFHEGFAIVQNEEGKYNYLGKDGKTLCNSWLDTAEGFRDGLAAVTLGGNAYRIGTDGKVKEVLDNGRKAGNAPKID